MLKKSLATAAVVCAVPALASASWFLSTQAKSAGGTIATTINGVQTAQGVAAGPTFRSYTTSAGVDIVVTPDAGYTISSYTKNGVTLGDNKNPLKLAGLTTSLPGDKNADKDFSATFTPTMYSVSASMAGGTVTPAGLGNLYQNYKLTEPLTFTFSPKPGYRIVSISGIPSDITPPALPAAVGARVQVTFPKGYVFGTRFALSGVADNVTPGISAILPQSVAPGATVTLSASSNGATPAIDMSGAVWTYVSGPLDKASYSTDANGKVVTTVTAAPAIALDTTTAPGKALFTAPTNLGQYRFTVTAGGHTAMAVVNVAAVGSNSCQSCHAASNIPAVADTSSHATCQACHFEGTGHPGTVDSGTVSPSTFVVNMDNVTNGNGAAAAKGTNFCASCHGATGSAALAVPALTTHQDKNCGDCHASPHEPHVASVACQSCHTGVHTAATMGTNGCLDCHNGHNPTVNTKPLVGTAGSHPPVTLYTYEEIGMQMAGGQKVPVQVDASGNGMPYSPKQTCGTSGCHVKNGADYSYDKISDTAFHSHEGRAEMMDVNNGDLLPGLHIPWVQSTAMVGKW